MKIRSPDLSMVGATIILPFTKVWFALPKSVRTYLPWLHSTCACSRDTRSSSRTMAQPDARPILVLGLEIGNRAPLPVPPTHSNVAADCATDMISVGGTFPDESVPTGIGWLHCGHVFALLVRLAPQDGQHLVIWPPLRLAENHILMNRVIFVPHTEQTPRIAGLPFFKVTRLASFICLFCLSFTQYAVTICCVDS